MDINEKALEMLQAYPLCDNCLGRQFALLGRGLENSRRGNTLKLNAVLQASAYASSKDNQGIKNLKLLATNGFSTEAQNALKHLKKRVPKNDETTTCFLCENRFAHIDDIVTKVMSKLAEYEFSNFLVGIELLPRISEREDEFKAKFNLSYSESIKHEFGRIIGKAIESKTTKPVEFLKPDVMIIINPFNQHVKLQINPLFIAGRYRKLVRDISQSIWICSTCRGKGCNICNGTGKYYAESVEELVSKPVLIAAQGTASSFHASGREDVDALMLGTGRPFVIEISKPKKRTIDLKEAKNAINLTAKNKVEVSTLRYSNRDVIRKIKKAENAQKEYRVLIEFEKEITDLDMSLLEQNLNCITIKQQTPLRVVHRRADLIRERYIYKLKVKKVSPKEAEAQVRCQGGLYVKELVSGDEGRTTPSITELLKNPAKTLKLDVLNVIMEDPIR